MNRTNKPDVAAPVPPAYANYVLGVLFVVMIFNFLDRQIITIIAEPVKRDLGLSDTQVGLMSGLSFAIFYTTLALPIAALADRWHRGRIIAISLSIWSAMTVLCGMAGNFIQLFLARVGVGIGEAGASPPSQALITDLFPPEKRASALGIYGMAVPIGAMLAYAGGGWVTENVGWRTAFFLAGAPGILVAAVVYFSVRETRPVTPLRKAFQADPSRLTLKQALAELASKATYWHLIAAGALLQFAAYGNSSFFGSFFVRQHGMDYTELGWKLALMTGPVGAFGAWFGGRTSDKLARRAKGLPLQVNGVILAACVPFFTLGLYVDSGDLAILLFGSSTFAATYYYGSTFASVQELASTETRAMAVAIYLLVASMIGLGFGPFFVGLLSDFLAGQNPTTDAERGGLQLAMVVCVAFNLWAAAHFWIAARTMKKDTTHA